MDLKDVKVKINTLISAIGDVSSTISQVEKILNDSISKKTEAENELKSIRSEIENYWKEHNKNKNEFFESIQKEKNEANTLKNESNELIRIAQFQTMEAERFLASAKSKEVQISDRLKEVESLKAQLEEKLSKAREYANTLK